MRLGGRARAWCCAIPSRLSAWAYAAALLCLLLPATGFSAGVQHTYDEAGRLVQSTGSGGSVQYRYDSAGNLIEVVRASATNPVIAEVTPEAGYAGRTVIIRGQGFGLTPAENRVRFNGVTATVTAASFNELTTTVPSGAGSGSVTVKVGTKTATSPRPFFIIQPSLYGSPRIDSFNPLIGVAGDTVTVQGSGFGTNLSNVWARLNARVAPVTATSDTQLSFTIPANATSGKVNVATGNGTDTGDQDFFVAPPPYTVAQVAYTGRVAVGAPLPTFSIPANQIALVVFEATTNQNLKFLLQDLSIAPAGGTLGITVIGPNGAVVTPEFQRNAGTQTVELQVPSSGTHTLLLTPRPNSGATLSLSLVGDQDGELIVDGDATPVSLAPNQNGRYRFAGVGGKNYALALLNFTTAPAGQNVSIKVYKPDGTLFANTFNCAIAWTPTLGHCDIGWLPYSGTYTVQFTTSGASSSAFNALMSTAVAHGTLEAGVTKTHTTTRAGQDGRFTIQGTALHRPVVRWTGNTFARGTVFLYNEAGETVASTQAHGLAEGVLDFPPLPATGLYTVMFFADSRNTGSVTLELIPEATGHLVADGPATTVNLRPGQNGLFSFDAQPNRLYSLALLNYAGNISTIITVHNPDLSQRNNPAYCPAWFGGGPNCDITTIPGNGRYYVRFDPNGYGAVSFNALLTNEVQAGPITIGQQLTGTVSLPGANLVYTFEGQAGQDLMLDFSANTISRGSLYVLRPDEAVLASRLTHGVSAGSLDLPPLPVSGRYTVIKFGDGVSTGSINLLLRPQ